MSAPNANSDTGVSNKRAIEASIRIGALFLVFAACFKIVSPFIIPVVWAAIIAVALFPLYARMRRWLGDRRILPAVLVTLLVLLALIVPAMLLSSTLVEGVHVVARHLHGGTLAVPPPPKNVGSWPIIGPTVEELWLLASSNLESALKQMAPLVKPLVTGLVSAVASGGYAILQFVVAIAVAGALMARADDGARFAHALAARLVGDRGGELVNLAQATVRSVTRGVIGVAFIQATLIGLGILTVGVPGAGLWALLCLVLGVVQLPMLLVQIPVIVYVFITKSTIVAVPFLVWNVLVAPLDNVLKPLLLGRGVKVPMVTIFVGAIGGFVAFGIIGLFVGAVVLVLAYRLFLAWLDESSGGWEKTPASDGRRGTLDGDAMPGAP